MRLLSCSLTTMRDGTLARPSSRTWQRDASLGANTLTIANGHVIDALRFVAGDFARVACMVSTQAPQWYETDTEEFVEVTSPDNVRVSGQLQSGAAASVHVGAAPWAGSGYRMEIYGREGTLVATGSVSSQRGEMLRVQGAQRSHQLQDLEIPDRFMFVPADFPQGDPFNVGQMYSLFADAIRTGVNRPAHFRHSSWTCTVFIGHHPAGIGKQAGSWRWGDLGRLAGQSRYRFGLSAAQILQANVMSP